MCGIAGILQRDRALVSRDVLTRMGTAIAHRGPDDRGIVMRGGVADAAPFVGLVSQRLSIVDRAGGHQPISSEDGTIWTVLNGEIYNFQTLRTELEREGHRFSTHTDTEVIVHGYEQWGEHVVERLDGMFAFALWDDRAERLLLARDRFGKKPLVYFDDGGRLAFASELQALRVVPGFPDEIDGEALGAYLAYMAIPAPLTIYRGVRKLPPAHVLTCTGSQVALRRYWTLAYRPKSTASEAEATRQVGVLLQAAVEKRLMGEVPLGALLSGGVDSTAVVSTMAAVSTQPVKTFSIGFDDPEYDELPYAREVARLFRCEHHEFVVKPTAMDILPAVVRHFGEPYADSSAIPTWHLARLTRGQVTVALNGDGGDEVFGGYGRHLANRLAEGWQRVPLPIRGMAGAVAGSGLGTALGAGRAARVMRTAVFSRAERYRQWAGVFSDTLAREVSLHPASNEAVDAQFASVRDLDAVDAMLAVDTGFYLPTDLLPKMDIASMAHSLELRSPLLDTALVEYVAALPSRFKVRRMTGKYLLKQATARRVPMALLQRRKRGFAVPMGRWFRGELQTFLRDHLQRSHAAQAGWLQQAGVTRLIDAHTTGQADYAHHLWVLLMFELWYRSQRAA